MAWRWHHSFVTPELDTPSGLIEPGSYFLNEDKKPIKHDADGSKSLAVLKAVAMTGRHRYFHVFEDEKGARIMEETTRDAYDALALPDAKPPVARAA